MTATRQSTADGAEPSERRRKLRPRQVRGAAKLLQKEARRILKHHGDRIAAEPAEAIRSAITAVDEHLRTGAVDPLHTEAERLDDLLHQHASFARKGALREVLENVAIAVVVALGARACLYEPFKIPSGSMIPTLVEGDHIFVNKFTYGVQIPFTSTVIGARDGDVERGDVIVFRFPINEKEDYIKRVIGLPGDEIKVQGRTVAIKRAGARTFEVLERRPLDDVCPEEINEGPCELFEEVLDDKHYVVRYTSMSDSELSVFKVPPGHLFVMGDNRDRSEDSRKWQESGEEVKAEELLRDRDLRAVTSATKFSPVRAEGEWLSDPNHDRVVIASSHRSLTHDLRLAVWRNPPIEAKAMFGALVAAYPSARAETIESMIESTPAGPKRDRMLQIGAAIEHDGGGLVVDEGQDVWSTVFHLEPARAVFELACGRDVCPDEAALAERITNVIARFEKDHARDARDLLERPVDVHYGNHDRVNRHAVREHFHEVMLRPAGQTGARESVRLRVFRKPELLTLERLEDAAFRELGRSRADAHTLAALGTAVSLVESNDRFTVIALHPESDMMFVLDCGRERCKTAAGAESLAARVWERLPQAASVRRHLRRVLGPEDVPGTEAVPVRPYDRDPYDRIALEATVEGEEHGLELEVWWKPEDGLASKVDALREQYGLAADGSIREGGASTEEPDAFHFVFAVPESETVLRLRCRKGLCATEAVARELALRVAANARHTRNFIDPKGKRARPFVPRGNVKGRAEVIWYPAERFWLRIR